MNVHTSVCCIPSGSDPELHEFRKRHLELPGFIAQPYLSNHLPEDFSGTTFPAGRMKAMSTKEEHRAFTLTHRFTQAVIIRARYTLVAFWYSFGTAKRVKLEPATVS